MRQKKEADASITKPNRRGFLKTGVTGLAAAATLPALATATATAGTPATKTQTPVRDFELDEVSIAQLQLNMTAGKITARAITEKYLARIELIDRQGPTLRSVLEINPDALMIAASLDRERQAKGPRGPLHGIPILLKDNIDTADKMATTAGSLALVGSSPPTDAFLVQRLRQAGAIVLGKTNLSEWANIRSPRSTSGWSGRGGLTKNPYALDRNTSGSSSGSAAAVAANLCAAAVGTETDGSIVSPSAMCGIVGLKPTVGLISRRGVIPISHSQDTAGPMARTVRDAAILLGALTGLDPEDQATALSRDKTSIDYTAFLDIDGLKGARIGVLRNYFGFHQDVDEVLSAALTTIKSQGATLVDPVAIPNLGKYDAAEFTVLLYELKADLKAYLDRRGPTAAVHSLEQIIAFNEQHKAAEMPFFGQETFIRAQKNGPLSSPEYLTALKKCQRLSRRQGIDAVMDKHQLDALLAPTESTAWMTDLINGDHFVQSSSTPAAVAGYPSITVPAGAIFGLPVGLSFFGRAWSEPTLLKLAYGFEQATKHRHKPRFLPTVDLHPARS